MKKLFVVLLLSVLILTGCESKKEVDYSAYSFTDVNWTRDTEVDIETIKFLSDGSFRYYCACGNPVNDADMCETYTYHEKTKEIKLDCFETTEETITTIKIVKSTEDELQLDFDGDIRVFTKETNEE